MTKYLITQGAGAGGSNIKEFLNSFKIEKLLKSSSTAIKEHRKKEKKRKRTFFLLMTRKRAQARIKREISQYLKELLASLPGPIKMSSKN